MNNYFSNIFIRVSLSGYFSLIIGKKSVDTYIDMENKKSLIILKPMSVPLQKLHEVLKGVAAEENIEITVSANLPEITQFFSMGGQHVTLVSDPKQCALFLQENKANNIARHSKTLLFTPKDLPPKILDKFLKMGLTENVLDTAPPKTLLYKVKLFLKSLKANDYKEEKNEKQEQIVKSMLDLNQVTSAEKAVTLKDEKLTVPATPAEPKKPKVEIDLEPGLDYLKDLKKKKAYQEEAIQTNWSSKKPLDNDFSFADMKPEEKKETNIDNELDGYFRSKKTNNVTIDLVEDSINKAKKEAMQTSEEEIAQKVKDKKSLVEVELIPSKEKKSTTHEEAPASASPRIKSL